MERHRSLQPLRGVRRLFVGVEVAAALLACLSVTGDASSHGGTIISVEGVSGSGTTVELICASNADMWMNGRRIANQTPGAELVITQTMVPGRTYVVQTPGNGACAGPTWCSSCRARAHT